MTFRVLALCFLGCLLDCPAAKGSEPARTLAGDLKGGYQVVIADVNGDGRPDVIAVASGQPELVWYQNPGWTRHVLASGLRGMINVAAKDIDGDGIPEIAVAYEFSQEPRHSIGVVALLSHRGEVTAPWSVREIDRLPTSHRLRWGKLLGKDILVNAPLAGSASAPPGYAGDVPLVFYRPGVWKREIITEANRGVQHGVFCSPHGQSDHILTASFSGIDHFEFISGKWVHRNVSGGDPSPCPRCGASEVAVGHAGGREFIATIEPWHGNQVAYYVESGHKWVRRVIDKGLVDGHTLLALKADANSDLLVAGYRGGGGGVRLYRWSGGSWKSSVLEQGFPASSCAAVRLDGRNSALDLVCIGGSEVRAYRLPDAR